MWFCFSVVLGGIVVGDLVSGWGGLVCCGLFCGALVLWVFLVFGFEFAVVLLSLVVCVLSG